MSGRQQWFPVERPIVDSPPLHGDRQPGHNESGTPPRGGLLRRHRFALMLGLVLFVPAATAAYLYWDNSRHFESTDDAYIAARQFAIQPKVSGYITAVPVTDNQHVATGDVIARIDDRDYRIAVEQAQAQVANVEANISNIDAHREKITATISVSIRAPSGSGDQER
jgi:membrane fusion protein, multidrug efflux system